jgi:uncharacterized membrane protein YidH (DUF202 family)
VSPERDPARESATEAEQRRVFDEGLQAERTALAWDRTALTTLVVGALLARVGGTSLSWVWVAAVAVLAVAAVGLLLGRTRYVRRDASMRGELAGPSHALLAGAGVTAVGVSLLALAVAIALTVAGP